MSELSRNREVLTDEQIMNAVCTAADALDATRASELRPARGGGIWHATTIFDGDSGLLRLGRLIESAVLASVSETSTPIPGVTGKRWQVNSDGHMVTLFFDSGESMEAFLKATRTPGT